jgi:hypothetical protein
MVAHEFRLRTDPVIAYRYTGPSMDVAVANLLGVANCVAAAGARPALIRDLVTGQWRELKVGMWAIVLPSNIAIVGNQSFMLNYYDSAAFPVVPAAVDPGPDVYP